MNSLQKRLCCVAISMVSLIGGAGSALAQQSSDCSFLASPQTLNTFERDNAIAIGELHHRPYVVSLTYDLEDNLASIRACIPDAFLTSSRLGNYIRIASFDNYIEARDLADHIGESLDIYVRVIHENRLRP